MAAGDDFVAMGPAALEVILPRHLEGRFVGLGPAVNEEADLEVAGHDVRQLPGQSNQRHREGVDVVREKLEQFQLFGNGVRDLGPVVPADGRQQRREGIQITFALDVIEATAFPAHIDLGILGQFRIAGEVRQDVLARVSLQALAFPLAE